MAGEKPKTGYFLGSGGAVIEMDLPLSELYAEQVTKGYLRRVNEDGTPYEGDVPASVTVRPADTAKKAEWVGWAVHSGAKPDDAEAMTKPDLIDKYGKE